MTNTKNFAVPTVCPYCQTATLVFVNEADYLRWCDGELAQNAFPYLSADEREQLISGICPSCWDDMFYVGDDDEEDADEWEDDDCEVYDLDMGFDPYMGCYSDDC